MTKPQLIIPMSGIGKRFIDAGYIDPKPLIIVDGKPIIQHILDMFGNPTDVIFICNELHLKTTNMKNILQSLSSDCKIVSVSNDNRRGPVDAVLQAKDFIDDNREVIVSYCDYASDWDYNGFLNKARQNNFDGMLACYTGFHPHMLGSDNYAYLEVDGEIVTKVNEKTPTKQNKLEEIASNGAYYFRRGDILKKYFSKFVDEGITINNEFYVSLVYNLLIKDGLKVSYFLINHMLQWGTPYDLENYIGWSNYFNKPNRNESSICNPKNTTLILPMAGKGSRFLIDGFSTPKPLLDIDGKPMILQAVSSLPSSDKSVFVILKEHKDEYNIDVKIKDTVHGSDTVIIDEVTDGQARTCMMAINNKHINPDDPIMISACDNGVYYNEDEYVKLMNNTDIDIIVWSFRNNQASKTNPNAYAWLDVDGDGFIKHVSCKKFIYDNPLTTHAIIGTMFFRKAKYFIDGFNKNVYENVRTNNEFYVDDVLNQNIKDGLKVKVFEVENYICWGTPNDYKTYQYWSEYFKNKNKNG